MHIKLILDLKDVRYMTDYFKKLRLPADQGLRDAIARTVVQFERIVDNVFTDCDSLKASGIWHKLPDELSLRPELWREFIAWPNIVYIIGSGNDDDKLKLVGEASGADCSEIVKLADKSLDEDSDKPYNDVINAWLQDMRSKYDPKTTMVCCWSWY